MPVVFHERGGGSGGARGKFPALLKVKQALHPPPVKHPQSAALFGDPPFKGTLHFVRLTFFTEANHSSINVPHADVATALQYATLAIRPISVYSAQYGSSFSTIAGMSCSTM